MACYRQHGDLVSSIAKLNRRLKEPLKNTLNPKPTEMNAFYKGLLK